MFEVDSADTCAGKFRLRLMWARAEGLKCEDPGAMPRHFQEEMAKAKKMGVGVRGECLSEGSGLGLGGLILTMLFFTLFVKGPGG
jgi:hypothetical protein